MTSYPQQTKELVVDINNNLKKIRANTTLGQNSFLYKTVPDWNYLPPVVIEYRSIAAFKSQLSDQSGRPLSTVFLPDIPPRRNVESIFKD